MVKRYPLPAERKDVTIFSFARPCSSQVCLSVCLSVSTRCEMATWKGSLVYIFVGCVAIKNIFETS